VILSNMLIASPLSPNQFAGPWNHAVGSSFGGTRCQGEPASEHKTS